MTTVELPSGVRHYTTTCFAETWEAYDALTLEDDWREHKWYTNATGRCNPNLPDARIHREKVAAIRGHNIIVFPPLHDRTPVAA